MTRSFRFPSSWLLAALLALAALNVSADETMDAMWGPSSRKPIDTSDRAALFRDGNYGMFMHWGLYSHLGGQWQGETFYGIGEWIKRQMKISDADYMAIAKEFNPSGFDAKAIAQTAKDAGMKWIIITSKHHEGFAMFKSKHPFNIVDASPFQRDPMKELAQACREAGLGFGFYYSHNQDWTAPGATGGPAQNADGSPASFEQYFNGKCLPQVQEICTQYGPLNFIWFDTPGKMPRELVVKLADYVRKAQPGALLCSRIGYDLGDYESKGDMEVPPRNIDGLWETCDTTNDSWSYAWYDQNWKDAREILSRLVATVGRGGTYLLNAGPDGKGRIPASAAAYLRKAGEWIARYPQVVYGAGPSPWGHALPWGDVTSQGHTLSLVVFNWPADGKLWLPGLQAEIEAAGAVSQGKLVPVAWAKQGSWTVLTLPPAAPDHPASVIALRLKGPAQADQSPAICPTPGLASTLPVEFAEPQGVEKKGIRWMEKFGEWKFATQASQWTAAGRVTWTVNVGAPGDYHVELTYRSDGPTPWIIETDEGAKLQNRQNGSPVYQTYPFGLLTFKTAGQHTIAVGVADPAKNQASLESIRLIPAE